MRRRFPVEADERPFDDRMLVLAALVNGASRYPELRLLLPEREPGAVDCPCRNYPRLASFKVFCGTCGGLGWVPAPEAAEPDAESK